MSNTEKPNNSPIESEKTGKDHTSKENLSETLDLVVENVSVTDDNVYKPDSLQTPEQHQRDTVITGLLRYYVKAYDDKRIFQNSARKKLFRLCFFVVLAFSVLFAALVATSILFPNKITSTSSVIAYITSCISFLGLIFELLTIITKYCFPENSEQYITQIVQEIQENDLKHKKASIAFANRDSAKEGMQILEDDFTSDGRH